MRWSTWLRWSRLGRAIRWLVGRDVAEAVASGLTWDLSKVEGEIALIPRDRIVGNPAPGGPVFLKPAEPGEGRQPVAATLPVNPRDLLWMGRPLDSLTRDELLAAIHAMYLLLEESRASTARAWEMFDLSLRQALASYYGRQMPGEGR